jgi:hypothetical protein
MVSNNLFTYSIKIFSEIAFDIVYFPLWWYSRGTLITFNRLTQFVINQERNWALLVWAKNIFKPMYGLTDIQGRLISVLMRLIQIIFRGIIMLVVCFIALAFFLAWILAPAFVLVEIIYQIIYFL